MEQYNQEGERLYMCLHRNTYGKPDGANLWGDERDDFILEKFNTRDIEVENINFRYEKENVLKNFSMQVEKGKMIALVGQSGSE